MQEATICNVQDLIVSQHSTGHCSNSVGKSCDANDTAGRKTSPMLNLLLSLWEIGVKNSLQTSA